MSSPVDVVVVGSCNMDLISYASRFPKAGETLTGHKFQMGCGGKGANQCVMAAKLNGHTAMIGRVGDDAFGEVFLRNFKEMGVNTDFLKVCQGMATGVAPITVNDSGENSIIIVKGANDLVSQDDLTAAESLISRAKVVTCQLEIRPEVTLAALKLARKYRVISILNPAPAIPGLSAEFLEACDIMCCNETEAEILTGLRVCSFEECEAATRELLRKGPTRVILTMGSKGSLCATKEDPTPVFVAAEKVDAVDTTGAGDAFIGSLAYFLSRDRTLSLRDMVERASAIAAVSVTKKGTQSSYPRREDLPDALFS